VKSQRDEVEITATAPEARALKVSLKPGEAPTRLANATKPAEAPAKPAAAPPEATKPADAPADAPAPAPATSTEAAEAAPREPRGDAKPDAPAKPAEAPAAPLPLEDSKPEPAATPEPGKAEPPPPPDPAKKSRPAEAPHPVHAAAPKPQPSTEPHGRLSIQVWTSGGRSLAAEVSIDGVKQDRPSPLTLELPAGSHEVSVRPEGYPPKTKHVSVEAGKEKAARFMAD
jgi:hypothetical protein